jgi:hypothetical protein
MRKLRDTKNLTPKKFNVTRQPLTFCRSIAPHHHSSALSMATTIKKQPFLQYI